MTKGTFYGKILYYAKKIRAIEQLGGKCNKCNNNEIFKSIHFNLFIKLMMKT